MNKGTVLILGARSDIGMAIAHRFAREGFNIQLAARDVSTLDPDCSDIKIRHSVDATCHEFDALDLQSHEYFVKALPHLPEIAISTVGCMGDQKESEKNILSASIVMRSNYEGPASILGVLANQFEERGSGTLVGISSVAGDRGRASNYVYGSAKAGYTAFLSGLRNRLSKKGVHVLTVKPGFVSTKMTKELELPKLLTTLPSTVANQVFNASNKKKNVLYVAGIWLVIMTVIKNIPEVFFKNMRI
jgi:short-subunit dehydrogenase